MSISSEIARISSAVSTQTDLISQIKTALEGKSAGGGASVETCTVTINHYASAPSYAVNLVTYQMINDDGGIVIKTISYDDGTIDYSTDTFSLSNVVKNSLLFLRCAMCSATTDGCDILSSFMGDYTIQINGDCSMEFVPSV